MITRLLWLLAAVGCILPFQVFAQESGMKSVTVPIILDHNRMLYDGEIQRKDGRLGLTRKYCGFCSSINTIS